MRQRRFMQLDVFADSAYRGNPLAVVLDGEGLNTEAMQGFARWTHLSETTFLLPPTAGGKAGGADYRARIFTPAGELAFAGHPTLGSCQAWLAAGGKPGQADMVVQECAKGLIAIEQQTASQTQCLAFAAPPLTITEVPAALQQHVMVALRLDAADLIGAKWLDNGSRWMGLLLRSVECLPRAQPQSDALRTLGVKAGLCAIHPQPFEGEPLLEVRAITRTDHGMAEDPATGSLNASLAQWLTHEPLITLPYRVQQGAAIGRSGRMRLYGSGGTVWVQGQVHVCISAQVVL